MLNYILFDRITQIVLKSFRGLVVLSVPFMLLPIPVSATTVSCWSLVGDLNRARKYHTATLLQDGRVLVVGGQGISRDFLAGAELYDPSSRTWTTTGALKERRYDHTATLLKNGQVLVTGGIGPGYSTTRTSELYDPTTGKWTTTGSLHWNRVGHTATLLKDGTVLVTGGGTNGSNPEIYWSSEVYDPTTGDWTDTYTRRLNQARFNHTATLLEDGQVLVVGGISDYLFSPLNTAELYDPVTERWRITGALNTVRTGHTATVLKYGGVMIAGRYGAELYNPWRKTWAVTGSLYYSRSHHTATLLNNGKVLVVGGDYRAERYDPATRGWNILGNSNQHRVDHTATLLEDGQVLVVGGYGYPGVQATAELYDPSCTGPRFTPTPSILTPLILE